MIKLRSLLYESKTLLVYHGTHTVFNRFDMEKSAQGIIWFASDKNRILSGYLVQILQKL